MTTPSRPKPPVKAPGQPQDQAKPAAPALTPDATAMSLGAKVATPCEGAAPVLNLSGVQPPRRVQVLVTLEDAVLSELRLKEILASVAQDQQKLGKASAEVVGGMVKDLGCLTGVPIGTWVEMNQVDPVELDGTFLKNLGGGSIQVLDVKPVRNERGGRDGYMVTRGSMDEAALSGFEGLSAEYENAINGSVLCATSQEALDLLAREGVLADLGNPNLDFTNFNKALEDFYHEVTETGSWTENDALRRSGLEFRLAYARYTKDQKDIAFWEGEMAGVDPLWPVERTRFQLEEMANRTVSDEETAVANQVFCHLSDLKTAAILPMLLDNGVPLADWPKETPRLVEGLLETWAIQAYEARHDL